MKWDTNSYDQHHDFVSKYGEDLIGLLNPQPGELIADLGAGTGDLANSIVQKGARVIGYHFTCSPQQLSIITNPLTQSSPTPPCTGCWINKKQ